MDELKAEGIRKYFLRGSRRVEALIDAEISLKCGELVFFGRCVRQRKNEPCSKFSRDS